MVQVALPYERMTLVLVMMMFMMLMLMMMLMMMTMTISEDQAIVLHYSMRGEDD